MSTTECIEVITDHCNCGGDDVLESVNNSGEPVLGNSKIKDSIRYNKEKLENMKASKKSNGESYNHETNGIGSKEPVLGQSKIKDSIRYNKVNIGNKKQNKKKNSKGSQNRFEEEEEEAEDVGGREEQEDVFEK